LIKFVDTLNWYGVSAAHPEGKVAKGKTFVCVMCLILQCLALLA